MKSTIKSIGKLKAIIIPDSLLNQCNFTDEVQLEVQGNSIVIGPVNDLKREDWARSLREMAKNGDDRLVIPDFLSDEKNDDWTW